jgi:hypothetical protein
MAEDCAGAAKDCAGAAKDCAEAVRSGVGSLTVVSAFGADTVPFARMVLAVSGLGSFADSAGSCSEAFFFLRGDPGSSSFDDAVDSDSVVTVFWVGFRSGSLSWVLDDVVALELADPASDELD